MAVNENVYGDKNLWHNAFFQQSELTNKNKLPYFDVNRTTLLDGTRANKLSFNEPIDKSISFCGLGKESALSHIAYTNFVDGNVQITDIQDRNVTNFGFFEKNNTVQYSSNASAFYYDNINWIKWTDDYHTLTNYQRLLSPLTLVNPHNLVLAVNVNAYDSNMSNSITTSLHNYIQYNTSTHPNICRVTIQPFYGDISLTSQRDIYGSQGNVEYRIPFQLGILDEYRMPSKLVNFYSYGINDFPVFGNVQINPFTYNSTNVFGMILHTENSLPHIKIVLGSNDISYVYTEYYPEFEQDIMKTVACFGLYFSPIVSIARSGSLTDNDMYIGILDSDGIGHGEYLRGADTPQAPQNNWNDMSESDYDPSKSTDPNTYSDSTPFTLTTGSTDSMYPYYVDDTALSILSAMQEITDLPDPGNDSWLFNRNFLFQEPIECIVAWRRIHCKKPLLPLNKTNIAIGWFVTQDESSKAYTSSAEVTRDKIFETIIWKRYNNFLDYEPYTRMSLYFPFCGMKELPLATFMGHNIELYSVINHRTGEIEVIICVDEKQWGNMTGNCSEELQLSANKSIEYIKTKLQLQQRLDDTGFGMVTSILGNAAGATISAAHGNLAGAIIQGGSALASANKGIDDIANIKFQLNHLPNKIVNLQKGSPTIQVCDYLFPYILIQRPVLMSGYNSELYGKTTGFATLENRMKSSLRGYTEATNPILDGISCTETERNMIIKALQEGCIFDEEL